MQILPVAPYVDTPAQFNVKHKTEQWGFPVVKNKRGFKLEMPGFRIPSKISLLWLPQICFLRNDFIKNHFYTAGKWEGPTST